MELKINSEYRNLIPPLSAEEYGQLEENILRDGILDPICIWNNTIVDGHNRYEIALKHNLLFETQRMSFDKESDVTEWIILNQFGRRNISAYDRAALALKLKPAIAEKAKENQGSRTDLTGNASEATEADSVTEAGEGFSDMGSNGNNILEKTPKRSINTREELAKIAGVSDNTISKVEKIELTATPETKTQIRRGEISIHKAYNDIKREEKREEIITNLESVAAMEAKSIESVYDVVVLDPPWGMQKIERDERPNQSEFDYPTMTEEELLSLYIPVAESCHVWLWTTQKHLPVAFRLLEKWGLKYVCTFVWHKTGGFQPFGLPQYNCEFALYARKGTPSFIDTKDFPTCFTAPRTGHSEKPDAFYDFVRRVTAGRRLDMFNRRVIDGFDGYGNQSPYNEGTSI